MSTFISPERAAEQLGMSRHDVFELIETRKLEIDTTHVRIGDTRILSASVDRYRRQLEGKERAEAIEGQRGLLALRAQIAEDERWLADMYARGAASGQLAFFEEKLATRRQDLAARRGEASPPAGLSQELERGISQEELEGGVPSPFTARVAAQGDGTWAGRVRCEPVPAKLRKLLLERARPAHANGRVYATHVNGKRVRVLPNGSFLGEGGTPC